MLLSSPLSLVKWTVDDHDVVLRHAVRGQAGGQVIDVAEDAGDRGRSTSAGRRAPSA